MTLRLDRRTFVGGTAAAAAGMTWGGVFARSQPSTLPSISGVPIARPESEALRDAGRQSGGVTAVARRGKLIHFAAHGLLDIEAGTPMRDDALFRMMSSTKPVTAVALLQQIDLILIGLGVVDRIIEEPAGGAHADPKAAIRMVGDVVEEELRALAGQSVEALRCQRAERFYAIGRNL